jgi:hypothetical protein
MTTTEPPTTPSRTGTRVAFELDRTVALAPEVAWRRLVDWPGHADWIPMTRVEVDTQDPARFVAWSGLGKLALEDRMHAVEQEFDGVNGHCRVEKLGPVLVGEAAFTVAPGPTAGSSTVSWREDVAVPYLPKFLAPVAAKIGGLLFGASLRRMAKLG